MHKVAGLLASIGIMGSIVSAPAAELKFCDAIKDDQPRMACLQQHIVQLEGDIVKLEGQIAELKIALEQKLAAGATYKIETAAGTACLQGTEENKAPVMVKCDGPATWALKLANASPDAREKAHADKPKAGAPGQLNPLSSADKNVPAGDAPRESAETKTKPN
jgi:hypothetical protein